MNWRDEALCAEVDGDLFFPDVRDTDREAKRICAACPVQKECLDYAISAGEEFGVWGGTTEIERRHLLVLPRKPGGTAKSIDRDLFWQLNDQKLSNVEIAERLGCHADSVSRMRQEARP